jgi:hypothetical protein
MRANGASMVSKPHKLPEQGRQGVQRHPLILFGPFFYSSGQRDEPACPGRSALLQDASTAVAVG